MLLYPQYELKFFKKYKNQSKSQKYFYSTNFTVIPIITNKLLVAANQVSATFYSLERRLILLKVTKFLCIFIIVSKKKNI